MGNLLSRKLSVKDRIQKYEEAIRANEDLLGGLRMQRSYIYFYLFALLAAMLAFIVASAEDCYPRSILLLAIVLSAGLRWLLSYVNSRRIRGLELAVADLKKKQAALVKEYKKDNNFAFAKELVDKFDEEESRESFFRQVQKKKRDTVDKIADLVLGSDPTRMNALICGSCGLHNGLVDPERDNVRYFYCYSCKAKNERPIKKE